MLDHAQASQHRLITLTQGLGDLHAPLITGPDALPHNPPWRVLQVMARVDTHNPPPGVRTGSSGA